MFTEETSHQITDQVISVENEGLSNSAESEDLFKRYLPTAISCVYRFGSILMAPFYGYTREDFAGLAYLSIAEGIKLHDPLKGSLKTAITIAAQKVTRDAIRTAGFIHFSAAKIEDSTSTPEVGDLKLKELITEGSLVEYSEDESHVLRCPPTDLSAKSGDIYEVVDAALKMGVLTQAQASTLYARFKENEEGATLNASEIGRREGKTPNTIIARINKGLEILRETLPALAHYVEHGSPFKKEVSAGRDIQVQYGAPYISLFDVNPTLALNAVSTAIANQGAAGNSEIAGTLKITKSCMLRRLGRFSEAKSILTAPLRNPSISIQAYQELGQVYKAQGNFELARTVFTSVVEKAPELNGPRTSLAGTLLQLGEIEEAKRVLEEAIRLFPHSRRNLYLYAKTLMRQAQANQDERKFKKISDLALRVITRFFEQYPADGHAALLRGKMYAIQSSRLREGEIAKKAGRDFEIAERLAYGDPKLLAKVAAARERLKIDISLI